MALAKRTFWRDKDYYHILAFDYNLIDVFYNHDKYKMSLSTLANKYSPLITKSKLSDKPLTTPYREIFIEEYTEYGKPVGIILIVGYKRFHMKYDNIDAGIFEALLTC